MCGTDRSDTRFYVVSFEDTTVHQEMKEDGIGSEDRIMRASGKCEVHGAKPLTPIGQGPFSTVTAPLKSAGR